jgi:hypothetical protein
MATIEQVAELMRQNAEFMRGMQQQQADQFRQVIGEFAASMKNVGGRTDGGGHGRSDLRERQFRDISAFDGDEGRWKEWSLKFKAMVKESNSEIYDDLSWAEGETEDISEDDVKEKLGDEHVKFSTMVYNRLITLLSGSALIIHQTVPQECGFEVWRLLNKRYNPTTPMRGIQLMLRVMNPGKVPKGQDVQTFINRWEGHINSLERDYKEEVSDRMKIGILIRMVPDDLQDVILQHADRLQEYKLVKEKAVNLIDARARLRDPNAMDVSYLCDEYDEEDVGAVTRDTKCYRCGGQGHMAAHCATPKGDGKGSAAKGGKGFSGKGYGKGGKGEGKGEGKGKGGGKGGKGPRPWCDHCGKSGHTAESCWTKYPDQLPWKNAGAVDWENPEIEQDIGGMEVFRFNEWDIGGMEVLNDDEWDIGDGKVLKSDIGGTKALRFEALPGLAVKNHFQALARDEDEEEIYIGILEVEGGERDVKQVSQVKPGKLVFAGKGKITIDSGAAESVMPKEMLPNEPALEGQAKRSGVRYVAANGARMENHGEKKVRFKKGGADTMNNIMFQVTDVGKPLAAVSKILDKGNSVVFSRGAGGSFIRNDKTGEKTEIKEEKGTFVLEVDYYQPGSSEETDFTRQGR